MKNGGMRPPGNGWSLPAGPCCTNPSLSRNVLPCQGQVTQPSVTSRSLSWRTFSSAAEYAQYVGAAAIVAAVFAIHRKGWAALLIPILATALFLSSVRTTLILAVVALIVVMIFRSVRRPAWAATASVLVVLLGVGLMQVLAPALEGHARQTQSDLVEHQLGGVADPLHSEQSTLSIHAEEVRKGMVQSFHYPLGRGSGEREAVHAGQRATGAASGRSRSTRPAPRR